MPNNDLISRAAAIDALTNTNLERNIDSVCDGDMNRTRRAAQRVIAQLPAVDAVPVVHGEWIDDADPCEIVGEHWMCSNCEMVFGMPEDTMRIHHYCPFCGGKAELIIVPGYFKQGLSSSGWLVKCLAGCCNQMPYGSDHDAVEAWNRRANDATK